MNTNAETYYIIGHTTIRVGILGYLTLCLLMVFLGAIVWKVWKKISN